MQMFEGTDFDRKMDQMFAQMQSQGMSEQDILDKIMHKMKFEQEEGGETGFDPSLLEIDADMLKEFEKVMQGKKDDPEVKEMMSKLAQEHMEETIQNEGELDESDLEFTKKH